MYEKRIAFFILLIVLSVSPCIAGEGAVLVLVGWNRSDDPYRDEIVGFMNDAVSLELKLNGYTALPLVLETSPGEELSGAAASYMIFNQAVKSGDSLKASMTLYRTSDSTVLASVSEQLSMDFDLDRELSLALEPILEALEEDIRNAPESVQKEPTPQEKVGDDKREPLEKDDPGVQEQRERWALSLGFGPYLSFGESSDYFRYGLMPDAHGEYRLLHDAGYVGLGLSASVNLAKADGILFDADLLLASLGSELRMGYYINRSLEFFFSLSGGGSYMLLERSGANSSYAFLPYGSAGLGFSMDILSRLALYLSSEYMVYFEESVIISGFVPSAGFSFKF